MPEKTNVRIVFRIVREEGTQEMAASGHLHRLVAGWAVTCRMSESPDGSAESDMTLLVKDDEIRMTRKGTVSQDQAFRVGDWREGIVGTPYGEMAVEAWTHRLEAGLSPAGGRIEWEYDMRMADQDFGRCTIRLDISGGTD